jgi:hypothetical protein
MGRTRERLEHLVATAADWAVDLEIDPPTEGSVANARAILALIPREIADRRVRVFPSENGGIAFQTMISGIRMVEIEDRRMLATWVDRNDRATEYVLERDSDAATFLLAE